jgi:hypothetical protein
MAQHLSAEQIAKYRERSLLPGELLAVDSHLGGCEECRSQLSESPMATRGFLSAIEEARGEHLSYEQMDAWVDDRMDQTERELVLAHIGLCAECARQLRAYASYAPAMSAPVNRTTVAAATRAPAASFGERMRAFFSAPRLAAAALAIAAVAIITPILVERSGNQGGVEPGVAGLSTLPATVRAGAEAVLQAKAAERPSALAALDPNPDQTPQYPVSEVVEEAQPVLRWKEFGASYVVNVYNVKGLLIASSGALTDNHWLVAMNLDRGELYNWEVVAGATTHRASFRVLDAAAESEILQLRSRNSTHLMLGAVAQQYGMLSVAEQEFAAMLKEQPASTEAARLLHNVTVLRGR